MQEEETPVGENQREVDDTANDLEGAAPSEQESTETPDAGAERPSGSKVPGPVQERINQAVREMREMERERDYWREMTLQRAAEQDRQQQPARPTPSQPAGRPQRPTEEQFNYDATQYQAALAKYEDDLIEWRIAQRDAQTRAQQEAEAARRRQAEEAQTFQQKRDRTVETGREKYPDFEELVFGLPGHVMTAELASDIFEAENPADVAYYLGKNPEEAAKIAQMGARQRALRIGAIDARLSQAARKKETGAPPPPPKFGGSGGTPRDPARLARENPGEYMRLRNEGKI